MQMQITEVGPGDPECEAVDGVYLAQGRIADYNKYIL